MSLQNVSMGKQFEKKITWVIKNFASLECEQIDSDNFVVDGCQWHLTTYPKENKADNSLSLYLEVAKYGSLPLGWRIRAKFSFIIVNQHSEKLSKEHKELEDWFDQKTPSWGFESMLPLNKLHAKDSGFLVNGELKLVVEVVVLEVIGKSDVSGDEVSTILETTDVHGFQILPSQAKSVSLMFKRHSKFASEFRPKNPNLKKGYMSLLLSLIETICQSPQEFSKDHLSEAYVVLGFLKNAGFKLDWLEKKLDKMSEKKEKIQIGETKLHGMEVELKDLKEKCSDMEANIERKKRKISATKAPLSFDDVI